MKAKVYFSKQITPEKIVELYKAVGLELPGKVAVKVHLAQPCRYVYESVPYAAQLYCYDR